MLPLNLRLAWVGMAQAVQRRDLPVCDEWMLHFAQAAPADLIAAGRMALDAVAVEVERRLGPAPDPQAIADLADVLGEDLLEHIDAAEPETLQMLMDASLGRGEAELSGIDPLPALGLLLTLLGELACTPARVERAFADLSGR